jgi:hypothetical protein
MTTDQARIFVSEVSHNWVTKKTAATILGISTHTLKVYRQRHWTLGIHFQYLNSRTIRYHEGLLRDWFAKYFRTSHSSTGN